MLYAIISQDKPDSLADRLNTRPAHLDRLNQLKAAGRLVLAGPHPAIDSPDPGDAGFSPGQMLTPITLPACTGRSLSNPSKRYCPDVCQTY